jgi:hypothetical protein
MMMSLLDAPTIIGCMFIIWAIFCLQQEIRKDPILRRCCGAMCIHATVIKETLVQLFNSYLILYHDYHSGKMIKSFRYDKATNKWVYIEPTIEVAPDEKQKDSSILSNKEQEEMLKRKNREAAIQQKLDRLQMMSKQAEVWGFFTNPYFDQAVYFHASTGHITMEEYDWHLRAWRLYQKKNNINAQEAKRTMPPRRLVPVKHRIRRAKPNQTATPTPVAQKGLYCSTTGDSITTRPMGVASIPQGRIPLSSKSRSKGASTPRAMTTATKPPLYPKKSKPQTRKRPFIAVETVSEDDC